MKKFRIVMTALIIASALLTGCKAVEGESKLSDLEEQRVQDLYAKYTITFEVHGGEWEDGSTGAIVVGQEPGAAVVFPKKGIPQHGKRLFQGWYTDGDNGTERIEDLAFTADIADKLPPGAVAVSKDTVFTIDEDDIEVVLKPGTYETAHAEGNEVTDKVAWSPRVVYAVWRTLTPEIFPVTFLESKDGTTTAAITGVREGQTIPASDIPKFPERLHYVRVEGGAWFRNDDDTMFDFDAIIDERVIQSAGPEGLYLYPKWEGVTYTVTFDMNGSAEPAPEPVSVQYPANLTAEQIPSGVTRQYFDFKGWFRGQRPAGTQLTTSTMIDGNKLFYAGWIPNAQAGVIRQDLDDTYDEINETINRQSSQNNNRIYKDDYVIGSDIYTGDADPYLALQIQRINELLNLAARLLRGNTHYETVLVEDGRGGLVQHSFEVTDYDYEEMQRVNNDINKFKQDNPSFDYGKIQPRLVNITQTGKVHSVTIATEGNYKIEAYGGGGGHLWSKNNKTALGGAAGYVKGVITLQAGTVLKVRVGGAGEGSSEAVMQLNGPPNLVANANAYRNGPFAGGYNGGGKGGKSMNSGYTGGSGGGGASDVRRIATPYADGQNNYQNGVGTLDGLDKRIVVAAGGGGAGQSADIGGRNWPGIPGGSGGPEGDPGKRKGGNNAARGAAAAELLSVTNIGGNAKLSGTQLGAGADGAPAGSGGACEGTGGGGGGYYGGEAIQNNGNKYHDTSFTASGAGGSNYVGVGFTGTENEKSSRYGAGYVIIEYIPE
jgi:hypothetical protein